MGQVVSRTTSTCIQYTEKSRHLPSRTLPRPPRRHHASITIVNPGSPFLRHSCFRCLTASVHSGHVVISAIVAMWYARSKKYGEKNVMYDSYAWYNHMLSDASKMKNMPEVTRPWRAWGRGGRFVVIKRRVNSWWWRPYRHALLFADLLERAARLLLIVCTRSTCG